ncbi:metal-dependent hydrolase [Methylacidiphilum sp. Yel]|jgi:phosphoribosyl 1,2-cyclic phosphodiesterase|uniref:MBL fold metallo-hydrolase n=1 Tax=Methylacidiphilum sp. Yel TaxID=1847730 RepID=UPI0010691E45|nr:MBL fold metallo-hydrolase [Methylacidiphilum sp. Yel]TFE69508.1 metal-dependent hydrolase [Methylacidiphilum sp. Yel]
MVSIRVLASGSKGNAYLLETEKFRFLLDPGIRFKHLAIQLANLNIPLESINGIFITHEHSDHVIGLPVLLKRIPFPLYCNELTWKSLKKMMDLKEKAVDWQPFEPGCKIVLDEIEIESFPVPHDAADPVGFLFHHSNGTIGLLTDLGYITKLVREKILSVHTMILESNHDLSLLQADTKRPWSVKQRIISRHGHLSNEATAEIAAQLVKEGTQNLFLAHLSEDCNRTDLAESTVKNKILSAGLPLPYIQAINPANPALQIVL